VAQWVCCEAGGEGSDTLLLQRQSGLWTSGSLAIGAAEASQARIDSLWLVFGQVFWWRVRGSSRSMNEIIAVVSRNAAWLAA
jgi:hypothetical protein